MRQLTATDLAMERNGNGTSLGRWNGTGNK